MNVMTLPLCCNCYLVYDQQGNTAIIDPGERAELIAKLIEENGLKPQTILLTHGHFDHTGAAQALKDRFNCDIVIGEADNELLLDAEKSAAPLLRRTFVSTYADRLLHDGDTVEVGDLTFSVMHTPGHTRGGVCYRIDDSIFSGDSLFFGTVGRTDLYGGNMLTLMRSLTRLMALEGDYTVYPGHEGKTTLRYEEQYNPYIRKR